MKQENLEIFYDKKADILEVVIGEPSECYFDEVEDDLFEAHDEETGELKGYKVFNFEKRGGIKSVKILLPAGVSIAPK